MNLIIIIIIIIIEGKLQVVKDFGSGRHQTESKEKSRNKYIRRIRDFLKPTPAAGMSSKE